MVWSSFDLLGVGFVTLVFYDFGVVLMVCGLSSV